MYYKSVVGFGYYSILGVLKQVYINSKMIFCLSTGLFRINSRVHSSISRSTGNGTTSALGKKVACYIVTKDGNASRADFLQGEA